MPGAKPKRTCCEDRPRCKRCPLRMLAEGTLPPGYTVRHRKLVKVAGGSASAKLGKVKPGKGKPKDKHADKKGDPRTKGGVAGKKKPGKKGVKKAA